MTNLQIRPFQQVVPMIYAYSTPGVSYHDGWTKIGYTEKQSVTQRIKQQTHTADIRWELEWMDNAIYKDGSGQCFTDRDFHDYLEAEKRVKREQGTEWFEIDGPASQRHFNNFAQRQTARRSEGCSYELRAEQARAVEATKAYFEGGGEEFLWNAKPRFGKTLTAYDLVRRMGFEKVLIVTNRPSIANSWAEDFEKFIGWRGELCFVSETDALAGKAGVMSRQQYLDAMRPLDEWKGMVAFESLQGLKGSVYFGGEYDKLKWIAENSFDLLIVDESQEGIETLRTEQAFRKIKRRHTLYLSGTPFKQLAGDQFTDRQIFNWSYADEQAAKENWQSPETNPYETLPRLAMFTYQLSNMIYDEVQKGLDLSGEDGTVDYAFDLNEFFATNENGKLVHEGEIKKFLHALTTQEKYPFSTPELRGELTHTLWLLNRVDSVKALAKLLKDDPVFHEYEVVIAAGDGKSEPDEKAVKASFDRVKKAIAENEKTITLSVGQLTVGVTIPEWSGVLMLCNLKSPSAYMQAAFRAQNPCMTDRGGKKMRKETAYVFDFDPARTLIIFDEFANNLRRETAGRGTENDRKENIRLLLNFFPVLGEDDEGRMVELDAAQVLSIPRRLKSAEVVRHGFMSNFLFRNIGNVFGAPAAVREIIEKLQPAHEEKPNRSAHDPIEDMDDVRVDESGEAVPDNEIVIGTTQGLFGEKVYEEIERKVEDSVIEVGTAETADEIDRKFEEMVSTLTTEINDKVVTPIAENYEMKKGAQERIEKQVGREIRRKFDGIKSDFDTQRRIAETEFERERREAKTEKEAAKAEKKYRETVRKATEALFDTVETAVQQTIEKKPQQLVEKMEKEKAEKEKSGIEDSIRAHLRGFARTIPSFIMAYGDGRLNLSNFDDYTEPDVFEQVTGITLENFIFLRDGGSYIDKATGEERHFDGHLFDEVVFDDSVMEFWHKKQELANYFDETHDEDIFDYIPPQKTNQIFTPKWVVKKMVDELEANDPGCFDDPGKTFADLYMKSGLYITEIVKRLFRSEAMKRAFPDEKRRIRHILEKQVYGMAPTRIIYLIATNYILGFDEELKAAAHNFAQADAAEAAKNGTLGELAEMCFGRG